MSKGGAAVVGEWAELWISYTNQVVIDTVSQSSRSARTDQIKRARRVDSARDIAGTRAGVMEVPGNDSVAKQKRSRATTDARIDNASDTAAARWTISEDRSVGDRGCCGAAATRSLVFDSGRK